HVLGRRLRWQGDPGVTRLLPHRDVWRWEIRIGEVADGDSNVSGKALVLPVHRGAACRAEVKGQRVATLGCSHPRRSFTGDGDLLTREARLVADHGASAALALQAVAHRDARWFALNRKVKLPAAACGASGGHGSPPRRRYVAAPSTSPARRNVPVHVGGGRFAWQRPCSKAGAGGAPPRVAAAVRPPLGPRVRQLLPTTQRKFTGSPVRRRRWPCISNRDEQPARATFRRTPPTSVYSPIS